VTCLSWICWNDRTNDCCSWTPLNYSSTLVNAEPFRTHSEVLLVFCRLMVSCSFSSRGKPSPSRRSSVIDCILCKNTSPHSLEVLPTIGVHAESYCSLHNRCMQIAHCPASRGTSTSPPHVTRQYEISSWKNIAISRRPGQRAMDCASKRGWLPLRSQLVVQCSWKRICSSGSVTRLKL
jgi:hypothetical protein